MGGCCASAPVSAAQRIDDESYPDNGKKLRRDALKDVYQLGGTIGTGGFSVVKLATDRATGEQWACKIMSLPRPGRQPARRRSIMREVDVLVRLGLGHPNVLALREYFVENNRVYLIMELLRGGELLDAVNSHGNYSEADAQTIFSQLMRGVQYLHSVGVVHRDLKLDNLLLAKKGDISTVKIADFGVARKLHPMYGLRQMRTVVGTPQYMAPEVVCASKHIIATAAGTAYGPACDLWSCGVILFMLLGGYPPFWHESQPLLLRSISRGKFEFDDPVWQEVSREAKDLVSKLLVVDPDKRLTPKQVLAHPWMVGCSRQARRLPQTSERMRTGILNRLRKRPSEEGPRLHDVIADASAAAAAAALQQPVVEWPA